LPEGEILEYIRKWFRTELTTPFATMGDVAVDVGLFAKHPVRAAVFHAFIHGIDPVFP
jgi:hypothetical protein